MSTLHVDGRYLKDAWNRTVVLRGVNKGGFVDSPNGWWNPEGGGIYSGFGVWNPDAVKYNLDKMKEWGLNVLRMHTVIEWWINDTSNYRQHIKDVITWAGERGIYVIFEPYSIRGGSDAVPYGLLYAPYATDPEDQAIMPNRQAFVDYWRSVANELKSYPNVLFEIQNEPHGNDTVRDEYFAMAQEVINAIRDTGATQIIIVQWGYSIWCNLDYPPPTNTASTMDWVEQYPLNDSLSNIVYSFHIYRGNFHRTEPTRVNVWTYDELKLGYQYCLVDYVLNNLNKPVLCGEIGANMWQTGEELEHELDFLSNSLTIFNKWEMSYLVWVWDVPEHLRHGVLELTDGKWYCNPNQAGQILINKIAEGKPTPIPPTIIILGPTILGLGLVALSG